MSTTALAPCLWQQFCDDDGNPIAGGYLYTYEAGTDTPKATYTSYYGNVEHSNPINLDSGGFVTEGLWLAAGAYKFVLQDANHVVVRTIDNVISCAGGASNTIMSVDSIAELRELSEGVADVVVVNGYYERGDKGFGLFVWDSENTGNDDGGIVIKPDSEPQAGRWKRQYCGGLINVYWFGAVGDGVTDDSVAIEKANDFAYANSGVLFFPAGTYKATFELTVAIKLARNAVLKWTGSNPVWIVQIDDADLTEHFDCAVEDCPKLQCHFVRPEWFVGTKKFYKAVMSCNKWHSCNQAISAYVKLEANVYESESDDQIEKDNVTIIGAGMPSVQSTQSWKIYASSGTVISGKLDIIGNNILIADLGIDVGSEYSAYNGETTALVLHNNASVAKNLTITNVATLTKRFDVYNQNALPNIKLENVENVHLNNVSTYNGGDGIRIYGNNIVASNIRCSDPIVNGVHIQNSGVFGASSNIQISNISVTGYSKNYTSAITLRNSESVTSDLRGILVSGMRASNCKSVVNLIPENNDAYIADVKIGAIADEECTNCIATSGKIDWKSIIIDAKTFCGDGVNWLAANCQLSAKKALCLADTTDALKILNVDEDTGEWLDTHDKNNYTTIGEIKSCWNEETSHYEARLDLYLGNVQPANYKYASGDTVQTVGEPMSLTVDKYDNVTNGIGLRFYKSDLVLADDDKITVHSAYAYVTPQVKVATINFNLEFTCTDSLKYIVLLFKGSAQYLRPLLSLPTGKIVSVGAFYSNTYNLWVSDLIAKIKTNILTSYIELLRVNEAYFSTSRTIVAFNLTYPINHE